MHHNGPHLQPHIIVTGIERFKSHIVIMCDLYWDTCTASLVLPFCTLITCLTLSRSESFYRTLMLSHQKPDRNHSSDLEVIMVRVTTDYLQE